MELRKNRFTENRDYLITEKEVLDNSISSLRNGLSNNVIQYKDRESGEIITTTSSSTRKALQKELNSAVSQREKLSVKLETATDSINSIDIKILNTESTAEISSELGPLKYLSELTDKPMNKIINILLLVIIFVFDPLAISLVIAANFAFNQIKNKDEEKEKDITRTSLDISKEAGKIEKKLVSKEPKPLEVSDELLNKLQTQLDKIGEESSKKQKIVTPTDDLLKNIDKLSEVIDLESDVEKQSENKEHNKVTPQQNKRVLTYRRRDGGRNTETDRA